MPTSDYDLESGLYLKEGWLLFQSTRGVSDLDTCFTLFSVGRVPQHTPIQALDMGAGVGEAAMYLRLWNPEATVHCLSNSQFQLQTIKRRGHAIPEFGTLLAIPGDPAVYDLVYFFESFGYSDAPAETLSEAHRVLKPGGVLLIKDVLPSEWAPNSVVDPAWNYAYHTPMLAEAIKAAGFSRVFLFPLPFSGEEFTAFYQSTELANLHPADTPDRPIGPAFPALWVAFA